MTGTAPRGPKAGATVVIGAAWQEIARQWQSVRSGDEFQKGWANCKGRGDSSDTALADQIFLASC